MFRYTPPWQVLCATMESKRPGSASPDLRVTEENQEMQTTLAKEQLSPKTGEEEEGEVIVHAMEPNLGNTVFTISPNTGLQNTEQNGRGTIMQGEKMFDIREDEHLDFRYPDQEAANGWKRRDAPAEQSRWVAKSINGQTDLWTPPLDRESKLEVVKSGPLYDVRAYKGEKKPSRLYDDEEEDELQYRISPEGISPEKAKELEAERQEIIRSQAVRKSTTVAERLSAGDRSKDETDFPGKEVAQTRASFSTGFALCFDSYSPSKGSTPVDPQNIDTEQISFTAARQQFLALEKRNPDILLGAGQQATSPSRAQMMPRSVSGRGKGQASVIQTDDQDASNQRGWGGPDDKTDLLMLQRQGSTPCDQVLLAQNAARENLVSSSLGKKTHPGLKVVIVDERVSRKHTGQPLDSVASGSCPAEGLEAEKETPIEREIRLSLEREEDLWKQRGIQRANSRDELVEIRASPLLSSSVLSLASSTKGKEKPRVSFPVQREIEQETKREEDLQKEGRLLGTYSRGDRQQLAERRKVFEQGEMTALSPYKPKKSGETRETPKGESILAICKRVVYEHDGEEEFENAKGGLEAHQPSSPRDGRFFFGQSSDPSNHQMDPPSRATFPNILDSGDPGEGLVIQKGHFAVPIRKFHFSFSDDHEPSRSRGEEHRAMRAAPRDELYTLKTWRPRTSALIDQEIRDALQRELELQEDRRKATLPTKMGPSSPLPSQNSAATGVAGSNSSISAPFSPGRSSPDRVLPGRPSSESDVRTCLSPSMRRREEGKYAGIELSDEIDTEVVRSTKAICRRGVLAQLWETGQIYTTHSNHDDDNNRD